MVNSSYTSADQRYTHTLGSQPGPVPLLKRGDLSRLPLGHLDDNQGWHRYMVHGLSDEQILDSWTLKGTVMENKHVGAVLMSFVEWMVQRNPDRLTQARSLPSR